MLAEQLSPGLEVWGLQVPGHETCADTAAEAVRAPLALERYASFEHLAAHYCDAITEVQSRGPYRFLGWSSGGLLALHVALQLQRRGPVLPQGATHLFVAEDPRAIDGGDSLGAEWQTLGAAALRIHTVAGDHFTVFHPEHVAAFARRLSDLLAEPTARAETERMQ